MFFAKVSVLLLAAVLVAAENDLTKGLEIMACAKKAITGGVPSLGVPTHEPFVVMKTNLSWSGNIELASLDVKLENMTFAGLARWNLSASQTSYDTDKTAAFNFELYWDWLELAGTHHVNVSELFLHQSYNGRFQIDWKKTNWIGNINVTKPTSTSNGTVNAVNIKWHVKDVDVKINGLGAIETATEIALQTAISTGLNTNLIGNVVGDFIKMRLETVWWNTGKVWDLVNWCNSNSTSEF